MVPPIAIGGKRGRHRRKKSTLGIFSVANPDDGPTARSLDAARDDINHNLLPLHRPRRFARDVVEYPDRAKRLGVLRRPSLLFF